MLPPFEPEQYVNFSENEPRQKMIHALRQVRSGLGRNWPLRIGGKEIKTNDTFTSYCSGNTELAAGVMSRASVEHADQAIAAADEAHAMWNRVAPDARARVLVKAAAICRRRLYELSALQCFEVSKSWIEAYADVCEAIDFMEFYAREMMRLDGSHPTTAFPGEENEVRYQPIGVVVVIPPWNFPLAICAGMTVAPLAAGNAVVLKPASASPVVAAVFVEILHEAGLPPEVLSFVPGSGATVGDTLVCHPRTRMITFTGSKEVGLGIYEKAAKIQPGQKWLKRTALEMGGKDCIVVDETADVAAAAEGTVAAAFGFQGQKCSACSRLIAHEAIYDELLERVADATKKLSIGDTTTTENIDMGAVIDESAYNKINGYIEIGKKEGRAVVGGSSAPTGGWYIPPHIFADVDRNARIAQEEIFGPVLAVIKGNDFDDLLEIANGTEYGLTGALYSRERLRIERARREFHVGNLYFNRKCTGALVDVQPFGGFNMSGTNSKAGGRDYVKLFLDAKTITERF